MCYMVPVGMGVQHEYQDMKRSFTCCVGSGMESHALHGHGLYYEDGDRLWVNLYAPSTAEWAEARREALDGIGLPRGRQRQAHARAARPARDDGRAAASRLGGRRLRGARQRTSACRSPPLPTTPSCVAPAVRRRARGGEHVLRGHAHVALGRRGRGGPAQDAARRAHAGRAAARLGDVGPARARGRSRPRARASAPQRGRRGGGGSIGFGDQGAGLRLRRTSRRGVAEARAGRAGEVPHGGRGAGGQRVRGARSTSSSSRSTACIGVPTPRTGTPSPRTSGRSSSPRTRPKRSGSASSRRPRSPTSSRGSASTRTASTMRERRTPARRASWGGRRAPAGVGSPTRCRSKRTMRWR